MRFTRISGLCLLAACHPNVATRVAAPATTPFSLLGGAHPASAEDVVLQDAGSGLAATFEGTGIRFDLRNDNPSDRATYQMQLDNQTSTLMQLDSNANPYAFDNLPAGVHHLTLRRLNGARAGTGHVAHLHVSHGHLIPGPTPARRIEFVGEDLMTGMGLEDMDDDFGWSANAALSMAGQTAKGLQADYRVRPSDGWMPARNWLPQAVVVQVTDHTLGTVQKIRSAYPHAEVVLVIPPESQDETLKHARTLCARSGLRTLEFVHEDTHRGDTYAHYAMARELRVVLQDALNWHSGLPVAITAQPAASTF